MNLLKLEDKWVQVQRGNIEFFKLWNAMGVQEVDESRRISLWKLKWEQ